MTLTQRSFADLGTPLYEVPFCVLDLETTGGSAATCEITEVGAVRFRGGGEPDGTFHTLVNPGMSIPPSITVLTGITHAMVVDAPAIGEVLPSLLEFIGDGVIVGHNVRFDMSFLNAAAERLGYGRLPNPTSDTLGLARRLLRGETRRLNLSSLAAYLRSPHTPTHRALDDARATAHVFFKLLERAGTVGVTHLDDLLQLPTAKGSPHYGKIKLTERIPRRPGVYLFRDGTGDVIYVGKAKNLRTRVRSYFYGDDRRSIAQMLRDLDHIETRVCSTEIEAEITEIRLIAEHVPRYNRRSKPPKSSHWVKLTTDRFPRLSLVRTYRDDDALYLGPFRSRKAAERVMFGIWDAVPIRRCRPSRDGASRACQFAELGVAICPCQGDVDEASYGEVVGKLIAGVEDDPEILLEPLRSRMALHAAAERYEEAATVRDRHDAVARAIRDRRRWQSLASSGRIWAERGDGDAVLLETGRFVASWNGHTAVMAPPHGEPTTSVPPSVAVAEEARLLWRWLDDDAMEIIEGTMALPRTPARTCGERRQATSEPSSTAASGRSRTTPSGVSAPMRRTSERNPPTRSGSKPVTAAT
ncbi:MAG: DEDD exonuclease domain-containing protein [Acidimicrobiia bacterium]|nr:DEDD exonuclease domain-containing protein [Acidimicrobiia bacterium]NNC76045.1 DEDD exonuclease domain-containing protein [Acidimicrobiia bacterium]